MMFCSLTMLVISLIPNTIVTDPCFYFMKFHSSKISNIRMHYSIVSNM